MTKKESPSRTTATMSDIIQILPEPELEFRYGQKLHDPHDGLGLFGPYTTDAPSHPKNIVYGVIGPKEGVTASVATLSGV
jgi:hypothetical protein